MLTKILILSTLLLSGCQLYGGLAVHDKSFDSEFEEDRLIAEVGVSQEVTENFEVYLEHLSQPMYNEKGNIGGLNLLGFRLKTNDL